MSSKDAPEIIDAEFSEVQKEPAPKFTPIWADRLALFFLVIWLLFTTWSGTTQCETNCFSAFWNVTTEGLKIIILPIWLIGRVLDFLGTGRIRGYD
jgi:hypothetical protein